ncbi:VOC family protein [Marmoricola sp. RAF53]|uniref:VOC family protein n=1 Tax=Marmoricola sp. RAF53 TaxID=3233059 RepID=UPI003F950A94
MSVDSLVLEVPDPAASDLLHKALGVDHLVTTEPASSPSEGFRGFTLSLVCKQPADVDALVEAALAAGASVLKPAAKSFWGYGAVLQGPDGIVWKLAASSKKNSGPAVGEFEHLVLLLGVEDVKATKQFYVDRGFAVRKSYGGKYAELVSEPVNLALYPRKAAAKDAGIDPAGSGSHRITLRGDRGTFIDPDGFVWA